MEPSPPKFSADDLLAQLGWVKALAHRLVVDPNVADDVLQRVCLIALQKPPANVSGEGGLRRWLSTLTRRQARHVGRAEWRRAAREQRVAQATADALPATVDVAARREILQALVQAVAELDDKDLSVLTQRYFDGLEVGTMAQLLKVSPEAVRQRLVRARSRLAARLQRDMGSDRSRWLAVVSPVTLPAAFAPTAPVTALTLAKPLGALIVAKSVPVLGVKFALGLAVVAALSAGGWWLLEGGGVEAPSGGTATVVAVLPDEPADGPPQPFELPRQSATALVREHDGVPATNPITAEAATDAPVLALPNPRPWDGALGSFLGDSPDLAALDRVLREALLTVEVVPGSVVTDAADGSVQGQLLLAGAALEAGFGIDAEGAYRVWLQGAQVADQRPDVSGLDIAFNFTDAGGWADNVSTLMEFSPRVPAVGDGSDLSRDGQSIAGWLLSIGREGTHGRPVILSRLEQSISLQIEGGDPVLDEAWAHDTSTYDLWLLLLRNHAP